MNISERAEEVLEGLWIEIVEGKKEKCNISIFKHDEAIEELIDKGCIKIYENMISLTVRGKEEAKNCIRRHRLAERLFADLIAIKKGMIHETSCKLEHLLHKGIDENICTLLGHPKTCPHGRPIPEGNCCRDAKRMPKKLITSLDGLRVDKRAKVSYLQASDKASMQKLLAIGVLPNTEIQLTQKFPSYVIKIGKSRFAIDEELASQIYVRII